MQNSKAVYGAKTLGELVDAIKLAGCLSVYVPYDDLEWVDPGTHSLEAFAGIVASADVRCMPLIDVSSEYTWKTVDAQVLECEQNIDGEDCMVINHNFHFNMAAR